MPTRRQFLFGCLGATVAAAPVGWYGAVQEPRDLEIVRRTIKIRNLPSKLDGMAAVQVSDLHVSEINDIHWQMLAQIQALKPDLVLVTGDLVDERNAVADVADLLAGYQAPRGTWAVPGNREHATDAVYELSVALKMRKLGLLINRATQVEDGFWIVGVDDPTGRFDDLRGALDGVPDGATRILLGHSPDIVERIAHSPFDLVLVGHTHGGQVNLPFFDGAWVLPGPSSHYVKGLYNVHGSPLYVNRGIGTAKLPIRLGARPEITHFTFHGA
jgi:predicted MPP superfamily phosphohydrolase